MREIKFRAWDKQNSVMVDLKNEWLEHICECHCGLQGYTKSKLSIALAYSNRYVVMQYTGLKDAKNREIYEGDIVNHGDNYPSEVIWDNKEFWLDGPGFCLRESGYEKREGYKYRYHGLPGFTNPIEVIGNIYENSNLLK